jgi:hypothetical protein
VQIDCRKVSWSKYGLEKEANLWSSAVNKVGVAFNEAPVFARSLRKHFVGSHDVVTVRRNVTPVYELSVSDQVL